MAFLALGVWRLISDHEPPYDETARAPDGTLAVSAYTSGPAVIAAWPSVARAEVYHVRLFGEDGVVLLERDIADTTIVVDVATLSPQAARSALYWEIEALDPLRQVLARSGLRKVVYPEDLRR